MKTYFQLKEELNELSKKTLNTYRRNVRTRLGHQATGDYHPVDNDVKMGWELDQYHDAARRHVKGDKLAKKKIDAIKAKEKAAKRARRAAAQAQQGSSNK